MYSTFLYRPQSQRFQSTRGCGVYELSGVIQSPNCLKFFQSCDILRGFCAADTSRGTNKSSSRRGRRFPTTAAGGRNRDSCRLWHGEQELRGRLRERERRLSLSLCAMERGGAHHAKNQLSSFPSLQTRSFCSSLLPLDSDQS